MVQTQHPLVRSWLIAGAGFSLMLLAARALGGLPLYGRSDPLPLFVILASAIGAGFAIAPAPLLLAQHRNALLRLLAPTPGRVIATLFLLLSLPAALINGWVPVNPTLLYLYILVNSPGSDRALRVILSFVLAAVLLWPLASALIYGLPRPWRALAILALPFGTWCFLILAGGNF